MAAIAVLGADRFLTSSGVLPGPVHTGRQGLWLTQARYGAPYPQTFAAIRSVDSVDTALGRLGPLVDPRRDVVLVDGLDGGAAYYRNVGWALPSDRVVLVSPGNVAYEELGGTLYYSSSSTVAVGPGGDAYLLAASGLPGLAVLQSGGQATLMRSFGRVGGLEVWRVTPGADLLGVRIVTTSGARPLSRGSVP